MERPAGASQAVCHRPPCVACAPSGLAVASESSIGLWNCLVNFACCRACCPACCRACCPACCPACCRQSLGYLRDLAASSAALPAASLAASPAASLRPARRARCWPRSRASLADPPDCPTIRGSLAAQAAIFTKDAKAAAPIVDTLSTVVGRININMQVGWPPPSLLNLLC